MCRETGINESAVSIATRTMTTKKQLSRTVVKRNAKAFLLRSSKSLGQDFRAHRFGWAVMALANLWLLSMFVWSQAGPLSWLVGMSFALVLAMTLRRVCLVLVHPGRAVHDWAVEEQRHQHIRTLTGKTSEELEKMLQYHLEQGNMEEADKVSLSLLAMAEGNSPEVPSAPNQTQTPAAAGTSPANSALPSWLSNENEPQPESSNLPDWMRKN